MFITTIPTFELIVISPSLLQSLKEIRGLRSEIVEEVVEGWSKVQNYNHMTLCGDASMMST